MEREKINPPDRSTHLYQLQLACTETSRSYVSTARSAFWNFPLDTPAPDNVSTIIG